MRDAHKIMQFRRSGQRDDRRRRVFRDTFSGGPGRGPWSGSTADHDARPPRKSDHYGDAVFMDEQPRMIDFIPRRLTTFALLFAAGVGIVIGLEMLYAWMPRLAPFTTDGSVEAFDLDGEGSLAVWFSSFTLTLASLLALVVFSIRRHKVDDYHGHYRVWLWAAACWLLMSLDETASLHEGFKEMMTMVTGTRLLGDGSMWWVVVYFFLLGGVGTRLLVDMRQSRLSSVAFLGTAFCYALAVVAQLGWLLPTENARAIMMEEGAEMIGNLLLLAAMGLHARYVILDAEGLLPRAEEEEDEEWEEDEEEEIDEEREARLLAKTASVRVHPPHGIRRPATAKRNAEPAFADTKHAEASVGRKLTKQEKKALRRRLEKMKKRREAG